MYNQYFAPDKTQTLEDINATIDLLYITQCRATKNALLNRIPAVSGTIDDGS